MFLIQKSIKAALANVSKALVKIVTVKGLFALLAALTMLITACDNDKPNFQISEQNSSPIHTADRQSEAPDAARMSARGPLAKNESPISDALRLLNLDRNDLRRRPAFEEGYNMLAGLPLIDQLAQSPFILQSWADEVSHKLQGAAPNRLAETFAVGVAALGGGVSVSQTGVTAYPANPDLINACRYIYRKFGRHIPEKTALELKNIGFTADFDRQLGRLIYRLADAAALTADAYSRLSSEEREYLSASPERFFFPAGGIFQFLTAPTHTQVDMVSMARKIRFNQLFGAFSRVSAAVDEFIRFANDGPVGPASAKKYFADARAPSGVILSLPSPIGDIVLLGQDDNIFNGHAALVVDLGGDDRYAGPVGAGAPDTRPVSILIDISGNDTYANEKARQGQGVGVASIGVVADLAGDDHYLAGDMSQGCGMFGVGLLLDAKGDDVYEMGLMGQGFGLFGVGLLMDLMGNDRYDINGMGQGAGSTMGFGGLIDPQGDDDYRAQWHPARSTLQPDDWSHAQGVGISVRSPNWHRNFSLYGGIGFLSDGAGDDTYRCSAGNCMGAGYFMSVGSLVDHSGNDRYYPENGNGMGFAVHLASGILIDREGDDQYFAKFDSGGVGADHAVGMLVDVRGDDRYGPLLDTAAERSRAGETADVTDPTAFWAKAENELAVSSYGSASRSKGLGILLDYTGNDQYFAQRNLRSASCGAVVPPPDPRHWSHALLLDLAGSDTYFPSGRKNDSFHIDLDHGLCYDIEQPGYVNTVALPATSTVDDNPEKGTFPESSIPARLKNEIDSLAGKDNFARFESVGRLIQANPKVIDAMIDVLGSSEDDALNLSLVEVLSAFILRKEMNRSRSRHFESLLQARDPKVRIYAAHTLGWWSVTSSAAAMIDALNDPNQEVRSRVIWALGRIGRIEDLKSLRDQTLPQASLECKRAATGAFHEILSKSPITDKDIRGEELATLLKWMSDPDPIVRRDATRSLGLLSPEADSIQALLNSLKDEDIYVQRAAAISLAMLGRKEGIPVLIDSLRFPSIDTTAHYDQELVKDLAFFCGTDFPGQMRYDVETWEMWWAMNGHQVDLLQNLVIKKKIETAFALEDGHQGLQILEELLNDHPRNPVVKYRTKKYLQDWITFGLLAQKRIARDTLEKCLLLQKKIIELDPVDPSGRFALAGFYARLSQFDDAAAVMQTAIQLDPGNLKYHKAFDYYTSLRPSRPADLDSSVKAK